MSDPRTYQIGGDHYTSMAMSPMEFCERNKLTACESAALQYICRHRRKEGKKDLLKAIHCIELLMVYEYDEPTGEKSEQE